MTKNFSLVVVAGMIVGMLLLLAGHFYQQRSLDEGYTGSVAGVSYSLIASDETPHWWLTLNPADSDSTIRFHNVGGDYMHMDFEGDTYQLQKGDCYVIYTVGLPPRMSGPVNNPDNNACEFQLLSSEEGLKICNELLDEYFPWILDDVKW